MTKETIEGEERVNPPSCLMIITDALISDCDQLNDCPTLDFKDALTLSYSVLLSLNNTLYNKKKTHKKTQLLFKRGTFSLFASSSSVTTGLLYCADSIHEHQRRGITSRLSLPLSCVLKTDKLELKSDCKRWRTTASWFPVSVLFRFR